MPLILAIEPDRRQAAQLKAAVRGRLHAELVLADTAEAALAALGDRVPDLVLTSAFLSPKDEAVLAERLRALDAAAAHVQTLTIPVLDAPRRPSTVGRGMLSVLLGDRANAPSAPDGCDPAVFADQCAAYLERASNERANQVAVDEVASGEFAEIDQPAAHEPAPQKPAAHDLAAHDLAAYDLAAYDLAAHEPAVDEPPVDAPEPQVAAIAGEAVAEEETRDGFDLDLSSVLDEAFVHELSAAIEHVTAAEPDRWVQPRVKPRADKWTAVPLGNKTLWPVMEGKCATAPPLPQSSDGGVRHKGQAHGSDLSPRVRPSKRPPKAPPVEDAWGLFDPSQCGFATLLAKLDEITQVALPLPTDDPSAGSLDVSR